MFEFKCISQEAFQENPHYIVFQNGKPVVTIWQFVRSDDRRRWRFVGSPDFIKYDDEDFDTAGEAVGFIKAHWSPDESR